MPISCETGSGIEELKQKLIQFIDKCIAKLQDSTFITSTRHKKALEEASKDLENYILQRNSEHPLEELLASDLQRSARNLSSLIGDVGNEDVLDAVFSTFCVGK